MKLEYTQKLFHENVRLLKAWEEFDKELQYQNFAGHARASIYGLISCIYEYMTSADQ